jgi:hypothetical protein
VCSYDAVSLFYLELYVKLSIYLSIYRQKVVQQSHCIIRAHRQRLCAAVVFKRGLGSTSMIASCS